MFGTEDGDFVLLIRVADEDLVRVSIFVIEVVINRVKKIEVVLFVIDLEVLVEVVIEIVRLDVDIDVWVDFIAFDDRLGVAWQGLPVEFAAILFHLLG